MLYVRKAQALLFALILSNACIHAALPLANNNDEKKNRTSWVKKVIYYVTPVAIAGAVWKGLRRSTPMYNTDSAKRSILAPKQDQNSQPADQDNLKGNSWPATGTQPLRADGDARPIPEPTSDRDMNGDKVGSGARPESALQKSNLVSGSSWSKPTERKMELPENQVPSPDDRSVLSALSAAKNQSAISGAEQQQKIAMLKRRLDVYKKLYPHQEWSMANMNMETRLDFMDKLDSNTLNQINTHIKDNARKNWQSLITRTIKNLNPSSRDKQVTMSATVVPDLFVSASPAAITPTPSPEQLIVRNDLKQSNVTVAIQPAVMPNCDDVEDLSEFWNLREAYQLEHNEIV